MKGKFILMLLSLLGLSGFSQTTENYQMQTGNFNSSYTEKNNNPPNSGTFNNNATEEGQFANSGNFGEKPSITVFREFANDGFDETATAKPMQIGNKYRRNAS